MYENNDYNKYLYLIQLPNTPEEFILYFCYCRLELELEKV